MNNNNIPKKYSAKSIFVLGKNRERDQ